MVLSIGCSLALYHVSSNDLEQNARRQVGFFGGLLGPDNASDFANLRQRQLNEDRRHLKANLIFFNFLVLAGGGATSYALARRTLKPIEDALESQTRFTADASHELRTPLTSMQSENEVALRDPNLTKAQAIEHLKSNLEEVGRLKALSEGLLALANSTEADNMNNPVSIKEVVLMATDRLAKTAELKKITIDTKDVKDLTVKGNTQNLVDVVVILLDNAIKYSSSGGSVSINSKRKDKSALINVTDQGVGITDTDLPHIFERFYRSDSSRSRTKAEGYGLGLAIAQKIVDLHHGFIEVRSAVGKGSTFTIHLEMA